MNDVNANAVVLRKVGQYLRDSVFEQLLWAIDKLGADELWETKVGVPELVFKPTGQKILFRGADKPRKLKSTKVAKGYIKYVWFEECDEFSGQEEIDSIKKENGLNFESYDLISKIIDEYNLICFTVVDESLEVVKMLFDTGEAMWENYPFSALERENSNGDYKKIINLMAKVSR